MLPFFLGLSTAYGPKDEGWHPCGVYCRLNSATIPDQYPGPSLSDFTSNLFNLLSCVSEIWIPPGTNESRGYFQNCNYYSFGLFEYFFMSFGLKNAGCSFPHLMHQCLGDLLFMFVYIDVTLVGLKSLKEHEDHLCQLITIPRENHLIIYPKKCMFGKSSVSFLGHTIIFLHFSAPQ